MDSRWSKVGSSQIISAEKDNDIYLSLSRIFRLIFRSFPIKGSKVHFLSLVATVAFCPGLLRLKTSYGSGWDSIGSLEDLRIARITSTNCDDLMILNTFIWRWWCGKKKKTHTHTHARAYIYLSYIFFWGGWCWQSATSPTDKELKGTFHD